MPSKTKISVLFNDICYLSIAYFDWKIVVFQQTVVSVYYILKSNFKNGNSDFQVLWVFVFGSLFVLPYLLYTTDRTKYDCIIAQISNITYVSKSIYSVITGAT